MTTWKTRNASQRPSRPGNPETSASLPVSAFDRPLARGKSCRGQLTLCQLWSHWSVEPACCYRCRMVSLDHPGCDEAARRKVSFQDDHASGPGQATSATRRPSRKRTSWQKSTTAHAAQAGIFKRRIRLNWAPAVDLDTLMGVLGTSAMRRIVCLCFWAPGTQPPTASACPLALGPFLFFRCPPALTKLQ